METVEGFAYSLQEDGCVPAGPQRTICWSAPCLVVLLVFVAQHATMESGSLPYEMCNCCGAEIAASTAVDGGGGGGSGGGVAAAAAAASQQNAAAASRCCTSGISVSVRNSTRGARIVRVGFCDIQSVVEPSLDNCYTILQVTGTHLCILCSARATSSLLVVVSSHSLLV